MVSLFIQDLHSWRFSCQVNYIVFLYKDSYITIVMWKSYSSSWSAYLTEFRYRVSHQSRHIGLSYGNMSERYMDKTDLRVLSAWESVLDLLLVWHRSGLRMSNIGRCTLITFHIIVSVYNSFRKYIGCPLETDW